MNTREEMMYQILGYYPDQPPSFGGDGRISVFDSDEDLGWDEIFARQKEAVERFYHEQEADIIAAQEQSEERVDKVFLRYYISITLIYAIYVLVVGWRLHNRVSQFCKHTVKIQKGHCLS